MVGTGSETAFHVESVRKHLGGVGVLLGGDDDSLHLHGVRKCLCLLGELFFLLIGKQVRHVVDIRIALRSLCHLIGILTGCRQGSTGQKNSKSTCCQGSFYHFHYRNHPPIIRIAATGTKISKNSFTSFPFATGSFPQIFPVCPFMAK